MEWICISQHFISENSTASKYGTYDNNNVLSSYNAILGVSAEPSKGDNCQYSQGSSTFAFFV